MTQSQAASLLTCKSHFVVSISIYINFGWTGYADLNAGNLELQYKLIPDDCMPVLKTKDNYIVYIVYIGRVVHTIMQTEYDPRFR